MDQIEANKQKLKDDAERRRGMSKQEQLAEMAALAEGKGDAFDNRVDEDSDDGYVGSIRSFALPGFTPFPMSRRPLLLFFFSF